MQSCADKLQARRQVSTVESGLSLNNLGNLGPKDLPVASCTSMPPVSNALWIF